MARRLLFLEVQVRRPSCVSANTLPLLSAVMGTLGFDLRFIPGPTLNVACVPE